MDAVRVSPGEAESPCVSPLSLSLSINYDLTVVASHRKRVKSSCWIYRFQLVLWTLGALPRLGTTEYGPLARPLFQVLMRHRVATHSSKGCNCFCFVCHTHIFAIFATCCAAPLLANEVVPPSISYIALYLYIYMYLYLYNHRLKSHSALK